MAAFAMVLAACGTSDSVGSDVDPVRIVATTTMLGDLVSNVAGDNATVETLMPVGADPHEFQASSQQVGRMGEADLIVANGLGLEESLVDVFEELESDGAHVLEVAALVDPLPFGGEDECDPEDMDHEDHADEHGHDHHHGSCDPHVWMDPLRMAEAAQLVAEELEELAPGGGWAGRAEAYSRELAETHDEIVELLSGIPVEARRMVTNHDAFGYFAALYDFEIVGLLIPSGSTLADPSSGELADLVEVIKEQGVEVIFSDSTAPSNLANAVAADAGDVDVVELYTGSIGEPGSGADTLIGMLISNARSVANSLS